MSKAPAVPGRLSLDAHGKVHGPARIEYNKPFPCVNGDFGQMALPSGIQGVVMHTMVGQLAGAIAVFNNRAHEASAHFGVDQAGLIHQFGPINGWKAWAEVAGNAHWFSIEFADNANPLNPLTREQLIAGAQLLELLSRDDVGRFPLQEANSPSELGFGVHYMGGEAWGGHSCPDVSPRRVRSLQRPVIIQLAKHIRNPLVHGVKVSPGYYRHGATGTMSLDDVAAIRGVKVAFIVKHTLAKGSPINPANRAKFQAYSGNPAARMPAGLVYYTETE